MSEVQGGGGPRLSWTAGRPEAINRLHTRIGDLEAELERLRRELREANHPNRDKALRIVLQQTQDERNSLFLRCKELKEALRQAIAAYEDAIGWGNARGSRAIPNPRKVRLLVERMESNIAAARAQEQEQP